ncbi:MAG TPA: TPM domain-containing protein [Steroidobacteraceae bacterium]|jgi:putative membrane protein|nr:TPM domain-containing protein [Steroidobacteraceae bacterium]
MIRFSADDKARITAAIHAAEKSTSGEFVAVVARASDHYIFLPLLWAAILALLFPGACLLAGSSLGWAEVYHLQLLIFIALAILLLSVPGLHLRLIPRRVKHARASRLAHAQFYVQGVQLTPHHSGVLLFVSLAERYVEIVADKGIHEKLGEAHWKGIIDNFVAQVHRGRVVDGFVDAITACGAAMAEHYPPGPSDVNELSDGLIEIG